MKRLVAPAPLTILDGVEVGGYASDLLLAHTSLLDSYDAVLASAIVLGVLRYKAQLDYLIELLLDPPGRGVAMSDFGRAWLTYE